MRLSTSLATFVFLAVNLAAYGAPIGAPEVYDTISLGALDGPIGGELQERLLFQRGHRAPKVPSVAAAEKAPPTTKAPTAAKNDPPAKMAPAVPAKNAPPAKTEPPTPTNNVPSAKVAPPASTHKDPQAKNAPANSDTLCEVPTGNKGVSAKGSVKRRGNCFSSQDKPTKGTPSAKGAQPAKGKTPGKGAPPAKGEPPAKGGSSAQAALKPNQIRLKTESTGKIDVGTLSSLNADPNASPPHGSFSQAVFAVSWPGVSKPQVAKLFGTLSDSKEEADNLRFMGLLTASGTSTKGPTGEAADWIVTPLVPGKSLTAFDEFKAKMAGPKEECLQFLQKRCDLVLQAVNALASGPRGLLHGDVHDPNIHWTALDDHTLPGLLDFGIMVHPGNEKKLFDRINRRARGQVKDIESYVKFECNSSWPESGCVGPSSSAAGASSSAGKAKAKGGSSPSAGEGRAKGGSSSSSSKGNGKGKAKGS